MEKEHSEKDIHNFSKGLRLYEKKPLSSFGKGISPIADIGIAVSYYKYLALINQIRFAATSLANAYKVQQVDLFGNESKSPIWERTMYLQDAFSYYNSCLDYIHNILYFYYNIENKNSTLRKQDDVVKISQKVKGDVLNKIKAYLQNNHSSFYIILNNYINDREPINQKTTDIKHRAGFWTFNYEFNTWGKATKIINGTEIDLTEIVTPKILDIDHEIQELKIFHNKTVDLQIELCKLLDFPKQIKIKLGI